MMSDQGVLEYYGLQMERRQDSDMLVQQEVKQGLVRRNKKRC